MKLSDVEFITKLESCSLDPEIFNHEAHLRLAWIQIGEFGLEQAQINTQNLLQKFVKHLGAQEKYHKTLTITAVNIVNQFMANQTSETFEEFISEFPQLKNNFKKLIENHYSFDIIESTKAKSEYLKPDLVPFR